MTENEKKEKENKCKLSDRQKERMLLHYMMKDNPQCATIEDTLKYIRRLRDMGVL